MKSRHDVYFIFSIIFLYFFVIYDVDFHGPDEPIYFAYTASVVEDGDLNVVNQVDFKRYAYVLASGTLAVSRTFNLPDFHNHGGVILWAPFYIYAKSAFSIATKLNLRNLIINGFDRFAKCAMSFSTVIFGLLTVLFTYWLCRIFFSSKIAIWSTMVIFWGTPLFYFVLFEGGNANIVACLLSILSIWFCSYAINMRKLHWFLYGLFFSICVTVKIDLCFQAFFICSIFIILLILKETTWINGIYFFTGVIPVFILKTINDYIKYGTIHIGEFGLLNFKDNYLLEQLFSSYRGYFYTSPVFYICLLGFILVIVNLLRSIRFIKERAMRDLFFFILSSYLFIKILIIANRYAWGGGTCGARPLLTEFPVFALLYARVMQDQRRNFAYFLGIVSVIFVFWNFLVVSEYISGVDLTYVSQPEDLSVRIGALKNVLHLLFSIKVLDLKLKFCLPLLLIGLGIIFYVIRFVKSISPSFWYAKIRCKHRIISLLMFFTIYMCAAYTAVTLLNISNNKKNAEKLKSGGFFENAKILESHEFEKDENMGSMTEMVEYFKRRKDFDKVNKIKKYKNEIYGKDG